MSQLDPGNAGTSEEQEEAVLVWGILTLMV